MPSVARPESSMVTWAGSVLSVQPELPGAPARVETCPLERFTFRMEAWSSTYREPPTTASPRGYSKLAPVPWPLALPGLPVPAKVLTAPGARFTVPVAVGARPAGRGLVAVTSRTS